MWGSEAAFVYLLAMRGKDQKGECTRCRWQYGAIANMATWSRVITAEDYGVITKAVRHSSFLSITYFTPCSNRCTLS